MFPDAADALLKKWDKHSKGLLAYAAKCRGDVRRMVEEYEGYPRKQGILSNPLPTHVSQFFGQKPKDEL